MNRRFSSVNGGGGQASGSQAAATGRYSLAGRPSAVMPGRPSRTSQQQVTNDFAGMNISQQQVQHPASQRQSMVPPRASLEPRRSSMYGKQSLTGGAQPIGKDPRPVRDKTFQANCTKTLLEFLMRVGYPHPISQKILSAPSAKDFQQIFKFLYGHLDPTYEFSKKFEEEVPGLMRGLRYPFAGEISKSQLYAVGSMHAWPSLLAMLCWMVELIQCCDQLNSQQSPNLMEEPASEAAEKIFFDYLCKTYKVFLAGSDNFDAMVGELGSSFDRKNESTLIEVDELSKAVARLESEHTGLAKEEPPLTKAQREKGIYLGDIDKFKKFISHLNAKKQKFLESIDRLQEDIGFVEKELTDSELNRAGLQAQVDAQDICPEDIDRMNADKDQLVKSFESINSAKEEASKIFWDRELQVQKKLDVVEKLVQEYNYVAERMALIPKDALNAAGLDFELVFNPHAAKPELLLNADLKQSILAQLATLREEYHSVIHQSQDRLLGLQESLDRISESLADKQEEVTQVEEKIKRVVQSYLNDKESYQQENRINGQQSDDLEQTIQKLRSDNSAQLLHSQQRLQKVTIEYDQLVSRVSEEKERMGNEIFRILEELINFKTYVETTLGDLEAAYSKEITPPSK